MTERKMLTLSHHHSVRASVAGVPYNEVPTDHRHATIFLDGVQSSGRRPGSGIEPLFLERGDLINVTYPRSGGFDKKHIVNEIALRAVEYDRVTFVGLSLGGLLSHDVIKTLRADVGNDIKLSLILADAPSGAKRLVDQTGATALSYLPCVPTPKWANRLWFNQFRGFKTTLPEHANDLTLQQMKELREHCEISATYPIGPWTRQLAYIVNHSGPRNEVLQSTPTAFLQSRYDKVTKSGSHLDWCEAADVGLFRRYTVNGMAHVDLLECPDEWKGGFKKTLEWMDIQPLV